MAQPEFAQPIITPFVVPTVLAAFWCLLRHPDSWRQAVGGAIRLGGDVDTLGAIVGALMGAKLGSAAIPPNFLETVLHAEQLQTLALRYHALMVRKHS
jgi:ADP-ribosylglycohydrolase